MAIAINTTILQKYHILRLIGEGGSGRVWLAEEITFNNRRVAIKEPRTDLPPADQLELQRIYRQEVQLTGALEQAGAPHLVRTFTVDPYEDRPLLVMAYMPGGDLARKLQENGPLPIDQALAIASAILAALQVVHNHPLGIVHRDIKPQNILFDATGQSYLGDFGLAQIGSTSGRSQLSAHTHPGSPLYMAPEQARSSDYLTPAADIFAMGCVLFEMLTGRPYKRVRPGTPASSLRADVPSWLDEALATALAEDPFDRYEDAAAMATALQAVSRKEAGPTIRPETASERLPFAAQKPQPGQRVRWFGIGGLLLLLLVAGLLYGFGENLIGGLLGAGILPQGAVSAVTATDEPLATTTTPPTATSTPPPTPSITLTPMATSTARPTQTSLPSATATTPPTPTTAPTLAQRVPEVLVDTLINVRSGPSTAYNIVGSASPGERYLITGRDADGAWWQIDFNGQSGWVYGQLVSAENGQDVAVAQFIPPLPAATPTPTTRVSVPTATFVPVPPTPTSAVQPTATFVRTSTPIVLIPVPAATSTPAQ